jgi:hypothetical protein
MNEFVSAVPKWEQELRCSKNPPVTAPQDVESPAVGRKEKSIPKPDAFWKSIPNDN